MATVLPERDVLRLEHHGHAAAPDEPHEAIFLQVRRQLADPRLGLQVVGVLVGEDAALDRDARGRFAAALRGDLRVLRADHLQLRVRDHAPVARDLEQPHRRSLLGRGSHSFLAIQNQVVNMTCRVIL